MACGEPTRTYKPSTCVWHASVCVLQPLCSPHPLLRARRCGYGDTAEPQGNATAVGFQKFDLEKMDPAHRSFEPSKGLF